ncbi:MAG TPA: DNA polymerase IV [Casimicrobiaceae bacterium]|nr:DNA polymerase IV [Casimicrobiaceae bacterium]
MSAPARLIAHLDMDAFYASVELLRYPDLRGEPVVIGGGRSHQPIERIDPVTGGVIRQYARLAGYVGRGVITTATYEARAFGVGSAMGLMKAAKKAPEAILLPVDFDRYRAYSRKFKEAVRTIATRIEDRGIDEIYIDLTNVRLSSDESDTDDDPWWRARDVARAIKEAVREATELTCSVAVAPNKLLAKIASELDKPDGLTILRETDVPLRVWPLPTRRINGIGPKAAAKLAALGIATIGELAQADAATLRLHFGAHYGAWLIEAANGRDDRDIETDSEPRSISRETTFDRDLSATHDRAELSEIFSTLCRQLSADLERKGYAGKTIGIKLRFDNFRTVTRDHTIEIPAQDYATIRHEAGMCLKRVELTRRLRLLGVRVGSLVPVDPESDAAPSD